MRRASGTVTLDGARLETMRILQPGSAATVLLLHEGLGSVAMWRDFPEALARATGCCVAAYSRRGYGASDPAPLPRPLSYMHDEAARVLAPLIDALGLARCILVGHSDGASIAALHAGGQCHPAVAGLVLMAPHLFVEDVSIAAIAAARRAYETGDLRARLQRYHGANVDCAFYGWNNAWLDPAFRAWTIEDDVARIAVPVLALQGADDEYGTLAQVERVRALCPAPVGVEVFANCGHSPHRDQPRRTIAAIAAFTAGLATQPSDSCPPAGRA